jgi:hypothetical protein
MKHVRIAFTDFPGAFNPTRIANLLSQRFDVSVGGENPDYVIFSVFGNEYLNYPNALRIFFTGENVHPDFNLCDYAFGYDWLSFEDRYYRCPNYQLYDQFKDLCRRRKSDLLRTPQALSNRKFCNFIYSNGEAHPFRDEFFHLLCQYRKVDSAGAHLNNTGSTPGTAYKGDWPGEKVKFQGGYKFSIAFENSSTVGYTTEKIVHALAADTIPIYWGNPAVAREFNPRRFINCHEFSSPPEVINRIREVDRNDELYRHILAEPFFPSDEVPPYLRDESVLAQFDHIFSQNKADAFRRNRFVWGKRCEERRISEVRALAASSAQRAQAKAVETADRSRRAGRRRKAAAAVLCPKDQSQQRG